LPDDRVMRTAIAHGQPPLDAHNALALTLAEELDVAPSVADWPQLAEALVFGPLLPPRYRLSGPGAMSGAGELFQQQLAASPRAPIQPADLDALPTFGLPDLAVA
jgi:dimethylaniline monooxygenase (N-oxide forming)